MLKFRTHGTAPLFAGMCRFDGAAGEGGAPGAAGGAGGATPPVLGTPPATPPPATGDGELGDAGKKAIEAMKAERKAAEDRAKAAETELEKLRAASLTGAEKAIADAKKAGASEVLEKAANQVRRSEVRSALATAGINPAVLDLAVKADEFATLKVDEEGNVPDLAKAVEDFKAARADLFKPTAPASGGVTRGVPPTPTGGDRPKTLAEAVTAHYQSQNQPTR